MTEVPKEPFVSCDLCVEVNTLALKTCLKCEVSMCAQHLQTHLTTPVLLQTHPLTNPVESGRTSAAQYEDATDCPYGAVGQLREELKVLAQRENQAKELEKWHEDQTQSLENCVSQLMKAGSAMKDQVFTSLQTSVSARLGALQTAQQAISSALKEEDCFNFLQKFASVHKAITEARAVDLKQGLESEPDRTKLIEDIRKDGQMIEKQVDRLQRKFFAFADPEFSVVQDEPNSVSELTFDPQSLGPEMTLSEDLKKVFYRFSARNTLQASAGSYSTLFVAGKQMEMPVYTGSSVFLSILTGPLAFVIPQP
ncbi:hypothetical protein Q8A67_002011 [Cirrhinus molitorella]|uniref:B box-type domain-containing protein n=1 Tax=Cirrhinus molitorella TaxID=172907 RepID=A0AA88TVM1_9TELE|nr:hypothetical protein Q8A67_002011 [Cirrhinus molitorella]